MNRPHANSRARLSAATYLGRVPFTWAPGDRHGGPGWWGVAWLAGTFCVLVRLPGWLKTRLRQSMDPMSDALVG